MKYPSFCFHDHQTHTHTLTPRTHVRTYLSPFFLSFEAQIVISQRISGLREGQAELYQIGKSLEISGLVEGEMENPGFEQRWIAGFSKLTSTKWEIPREFSR